MDAVKTAKQQLQSFLLRHGLRYEKRKILDAAPSPVAGRDAQSSDYPHQQRAFEEYKRAVAQAEDRVETLNRAIEDAGTAMAFCAGC